ncbi:SMP-30/gluconolactonase/LRE family protein [Brachybacterium hainanense]|uniref:SMP-30/gluconolactonase/LRE family protein n=1 Tax=Brachybacterium hainanense TaxID=1541174 RepID=A0ABV6R6W2_9MICO
MRAERLTDSICYHAEGPFWSASWNGLRWVDLLAGDIMQLAADGNAHRTATGSPVVACVRPRLGGGAVLAVEKGFALQDPDGSIHLLPALWDAPVRMNEGAIAPDGSFLCGSMAYGATPGAAALWRLHADGTATRILEDLTISNGLAFSADGTRAFYVDTPTGRVDLFDWDAEAGLVERRPFADLAALGEAGHPDGLTLDAEGHVWVAMHSGHSVLGLDASGAVIERIEVGARQVTACAFGGEDLRTLFITTSREGLAPEDDPQAGSLFAVEPGVQGATSERAFPG